MKLSHPIQLEKKGLIETFAIFYAWGLLPFLIYFAAEKEIRKLLLRTIPFLSSEDPLLFILKALSWIALPTLITMTLIHRFSIIKFIFCCITGTTIILTSISFEPLWYLLMFFCVISPILGPYLSSVGLSYSITRLLHISFPDVQLWRWGGLIFFAPVLYFAVYACENLDVSHYVLLFGAVVVILVAASCSALIHSNLDEMF